MQNTIYIAPDSAEQESLKAGVYAILKRWNYENEKAMQKEVFDFCRYWFIKNWRPLTKEIKLDCFIIDANGKFSTQVDTEGDYAK